MIYVTSDIHGNLIKYQQLLAKINVTDNDALIILGDVLDRGESSMEILLDIMNRDNFFMIMGNHEQIALACIKLLSQEITKKSIESFKDDEIEMITEWLYNLGGKTTLDNFNKLSVENRNAVIDYLEDLPMYEELEINNQKFCLVHGGLENFSKNKKLHEYSDEDLIWSRLDYGMKYFDDKVTITGHTPTRNIDENDRPDYIYKGNNNIAIDCGCGFEGGQLGCICLDTMKEFYV